MKNYFNRNKFRKFVTIFCFSSIIVFLIAGKVNSGSEINKLENNLQNDKPQIISNNSIAITAIEYYQLGTEYAEKGNRVEAIENFKKAAQEFAKTGDTKNYIVSNLQISQIYLKIGSLSKANSLLIEIIPLAEQEKNSSLVAAARGILGNLNLRFNQLDRAIEQYKMSLSIQNSATAFIGLSHAYYEKANSYRKEILATNDSDKKNRLNKLIDRNLTEGYEQIVAAIELSQTANDLITSQLTLLKFYKQYLSESEINQYELEVISLINSLPNMSFKISSLTEIASLLENKNESLRLLIEAQNLSIEIGDRNNESLVKEKIGKTHLALNNLNLAKQSTEEALLIAQEFNNKYRIFYAFRQLGKIELALQNQDKAIKAYSFALSNLRSQAGQFGFHNLLFELQDDSRSFLREYISLLLDNERGREAIKILPTLKLVELQDYFNDPCFEIIDDSNGVKKEIGNKLNQATIYTFISPEKFYTIVEYNNKYTIRFIEIAESQLIEKLKIFRQDLTLASKIKAVKIAKELHEIIISPLKDVLPNSVERLVFIRDEYLRNVPLEALIGKDGKYLIEKYAVSYLPGLPSQKSPNIAGRNFILALSESKFSQSLKFTKEEARKISKIFRAEKYIDSQFTRALLYRILDTSKISKLHIATHGSFGSDARDSYLEVYGEKVFLEEFQDRLIQSRKSIHLLTLSGCETAAGSDRATLGFAGVSVRARIPNIVASIWSIPDLETAILMEEFYRNLELGESIDRAKQLAQIALIQRNQPPRDWAGIILISN